MKILPEIVDAVNETFDRLDEWVQSHWPMVFGGVIVIVFALYALALLAIYQHPELVKP